MADIQNKWSMNLSISSYYFLFASYIYLELFQQNQDKNITFHFEEASRGDIIHSVYNRESELGILSLPTSTRNNWIKYIEQHDLEYQKISDEIPMVMVGSASPLYEKTDEDIISIEMLKDMPMIDYEEKQKLFDGADAHISPSVFVPSTLLKVSDRSTLIDFLHKTPCYHIATSNRNAYQQYTYHDGIKPLRLMDCPFSYEIGWIKGKNNYLSTLGKQFLVKAQSMLILEKNPIIK